MTYVDKKFYIECFGCNNTMWMDFKYRPKNLSAKLRELKKLVCACGDVGRCYEICYFCGFNGLKWSLMEECNHKQIMSKKEFLAEEL